MQPTLRQRIEADFETVSQVIPDNFTNYGHIAYRLVLMLRYMTLMEAFTTACYTNTTERRALSFKGAPSPMPVVESFHYTCCRVLMPLRARIRYGRSRLTASESR